MNVFTPAHIHKAISGMTLHTVNNYAKRGFIRADVLDPGKSGASKLYSPVEAMRAGLIWYFSKTGYDLDRSSLMASMVLAAPGILCEDEENNPTSRNQAIVLAGTFPLTLIPVYTERREALEARHAGEFIRAEVGAAVMYIPVDLLRGVHPALGLGFILVRPFVEKVAKELGIDLEAVFSSPEFIRGLSTAGERPVYYHEAAEKKLTEEYQQVIAALK